jgi:hypothetical protein
MSVGSLLFRFPGLMFIAIAIWWHRVDRPSRDGGDYGCALSVSAEAPIHGGVVRRSEIYRG